MCPLNIHELPFSGLAHPFHHLTVVLTDIYSLWPRSVLHTHSLPSPLTLCVWRAVPFTLIKTTNAPIPPTPFAHTPLPSALITEPSVSLIGVISSSERPSPSPHVFTAIYEKSAGETEAIAFDGQTFIEYHNAVTKR